MRRLLPLMCVLFAVGAPFASAQGQMTALFTFGTPDSVTRPGFTKVTTQDAYTPEKGFGFERVGDLLARDYGGSAVTRPADEYTASAYGSYRTTSDLTCAYVEGQSDNVFVAALPDGQYTVWLIASDPGEDPPLFEVWSGGQKKLDVRIPSRAYVYMEPFQARATGGLLRLEFRGPHGWLLNGLIIGKTGPDLDAAAAKADNDIFFLLDEEKPNWKPAPTPTYPPLALTAREKQAGYVVFAADPCDTVTPSYVPARVAVGRPITAFAAQGEFEPGTFGVMADRDLGEVAVEVAGFVGERKGQVIPRESVTVGAVRCRPVRMEDNIGKGTYAVVPQAIDPPVGRACQVTAGMTKQWWLTVHVPDNTPAGRYRMTIRVKPEKAPPSTVEWRLLVLPFGLTRPADKHWGTWLESFPPVGGLHGPERRGRNTQAAMDRLVAADLKDYRDHGFDLAIFNFHFGIEEKPDGTFSYDLSTLPKVLDYWKTLGADTPVAIGCEYTFRNWEYQFAEKDKPHVAGTFSPRAHEAIVGLVRTIHEEAQRRGWPRLYFHPIDEPGNSKTENRMQFARNVLDFVHEVPGCQTATTVGAHEVQQLGDRVDVRIYAYGAYNRNNVIRDAQEGHPYWWYANGMFYSHSTMASRVMPGFELLRSGAEVASAWGFDCTYDNPHNDFDAGHRDWNVVFLGVDGLVPTIYWELCREGVDDCRYVATLQQEITRARARGQKAAADRAEAVLAPLVDPDGPPLANTLTFGRWRWRVAREILSLQGDRGHAIAFAALPVNPAGQEKLGPNLVADPSFEAGPQADGFPTAGYSISDQYSEPAARPVEALVVTDEIAHSGRYCLKWDFSKAEGKGSVYGRDRWLIVNVQVPREAAQALRGKRVRAGYWFRLGGGSSSPSMTLRQFGKDEFLGGTNYGGGIEDPTVWNHFVVEERLRDDFEGLDVHIPCVIPKEPELTAKALFYIDDVSLEAIEEPPLTVTTALDEYYVGEDIPWTIRATAPQAPVRVALMLGRRRVSEQTASIRAGAAQGVFATRGLQPGLYTLEAAATGMPPPATSRRQVVVAPDPFEWRTSP